MPKDGKKTRKKILDEATMLVLENGFVGTSIDLILEKTRITKGAFFYHFKSKNDLARALIEEFGRQDLLQLELALKETEHLIDDPLDRLVQFIQRFIDLMTGLNEPHPGCLYASYTNESSQFSDEIKDYIGHIILEWRHIIEILIQDVLRKYKTKIEVEVQSLSDLFSTIFEGGFVLSKALNEPDLTAKQLNHLQNYIRLLFELNKN